LLENALTQESLIVSLSHILQIATVALLASAALVWLVPKPRTKVDVSQAH